MDLFLSYGHDEYIDFALRLKADLERNGHEVWFDADRLKAGVDWERYIEEGLDLVSSRRGKFLMLLTPHSVRRPNGYCLNELARAIGKQLIIVPMMISTVERPLSICRIQCLDFRDCIPPEQHEIKYRREFERLIGAVEDDRLDFNGAQARLIKYLKPIQYDEPGRHLPRFTGRNWVNQEVERWLADSSRRVLWITGPPGIGKSAVAAWLSERRPEIAGAHYCRHGNANRNDRRAILSLAWQLSTQFGDYEARLNALDLEAISGETSLPALFDLLFVDPLSHGFPEPGRSVVLVIDALDEAAENGTNRLASLIGTEWGRTPDWLRLIVTSRPYEAGINSALQALDPWRLESEGKENEEDIWQYLQRELKPLAISGSPDVASSAIQQKSEGLFLYVWWVREEMAMGRLSLTNLRALPQGLGGIYNAFFERYFPNVGEYNARWKPTIETICAAREPMLLEDLSEMFPAFDDPAEIENGLGSLFPCSDGTLRPFHESVRDWLTEKRSGLYRVQPNSGHKRLASEGWKQYNSNLTHEKGRRLKPYFLVHLPAHLLICERNSDLAKLLLDPHWMFSKLRATDINGLIADYERSVDLAGTGPWEGGSLKADGAAIAAIYRVLQLSRKIIAKDMLQFGSQVYARLGNFPHSALEIFRHELRPHIGPLTLRWPSLLPYPGATSQGRDSHSGWVRSVAWSPDGQFLLSGADDRTLKIWAGDSGRLVRTLDGHLGEIYTGAWSPDGHLIASSSGDGAIQVWDASTGRVLQALERHSGPVYIVTWSPDGTSLAAGSDDCAITVWDASSGELKHTFEGHSQGCEGLAWSPDGLLLASGSYDGTLRIWDLGKGQEVHLWAGQSAVRGVSWSPEGSYIAACCDDGTVKLWHEPFEVSPRSLSGHTDIACIATWSPNASRFASVSYDGTIKVWDPHSCALLSDLRGHSAGIISAAWNPSGNSIATCSFDGSVKTWDLVSGEMLFSIEGRPVGLSSIDWSADERILATSGYDGSIKLWDASSGLLLFSTDGHSMAVYSASYSPDGKLLASCSEDGAIRIWSASGKPIEVLFEGHTGAVYKVAWSPNGKLLASCSADRTVKIWNAKTGQNLHSLEGSSSEVSDVVWSSNGQRLLSLAVSGTIHMWDLLSQELVSSFSDRSNGSTAVWSPDESCFLGIDVACRVNVFAADTGALIRSLQGHTGAPRGLSWKSGSRLIASGGDDHSVKLWDAISGACLGTFYVDAMPLGLAFAPRSDRLAVCDSGGNVHVFEIGDVIGN